MSTLLSVRLSAAYRTGHPVLRDVSFDLAEGEILGIIGQSGSGKSTLALALLALLDPREVRISGTVLFAGQDLLRCAPRNLRKIRGKEVALVLQAAGASLNPYLTIESQLREAWRAHSRQAWPERKRDLLETFGMLNLESTPEFLRRYPGQISIGQAQRVLIAMALLHNPKLLILDEPTSALDFLARAEVLRLVRRLNLELGLSILYISHDLSSVAALCHRVAILHEGRIVEAGPPQQLFSRPSHPATETFANALKLDLGKYSLSETKNISYCN